MPAQLIVNDEFRWQALAWAVTQPGQFVAFLNNNGIAYPNDPFPNRLYVGAKRVVCLNAEKQSNTQRAQREVDFFKALADAQQVRPSHWVGYFGYDLKNQVEDLHSRNPDRLGFPDAYFVEPEWVLDFQGDTVFITGEGSADALLQTIRTHPSTPYPLYLTPHPLPPIRCRVSPDEYQANVRRVQQLIREGDVYELNYCIEFFREDALLDPLTTYRALTERSPMPFSSFLKLGDRYVLGASPERFLKKDGRRLISQPIKGTIRRGQSPAEDQSLRRQLLASEKERAENLMIVDLVRNDLARSAETGSVRVDELFGIYGFRQVYQMISTVSATLRERVSWADAIRHAFPMGSMTGAPKIRAMERIDELEVSRRGVYSGAIGYITPDNDFDFSVVIRSLLYNAQTRYTSFSVGSAITYDADPEEEWHECLLKAQAIRDVLETPLAQNR
ncbi:anthranilate synthase component I family protein [Spirosoma montaniterrae]|uniref:anthranilate synthase component I family protein n=1 Tax=Spirosoma montaniterrae TaxID=1178516 RepID=UPI00269DA043